MKRIIVNVSGLSAEEKQRVNEALAKIKGVQKLPAINHEAAWLFAPAVSGSARVTWGVGSLTEEPTHTPQQVLEMVRMAKQGHPHADLMALYAEDAKTTDKPWELWQAKDKDKDGAWEGCGRNPFWSSGRSYRRKPKTHTVNGVEVPDLRIDPKNGGRYYLADPTEPEFTYNYAVTSDRCDTVWAERGLCYEPTEAGRQAAIIHAKAWLGIA